MPGTVCAVPGFFIGVVYFTNPTESLRQRHCPLMSRKMWNRMPTSSGNGFKTYLFSYPHNGDTWTIEIPAEDYEDAKARLAKLPSATYDGELVAKVPVPFGPVVRLIAWVRNSIQALPPARP